MNNWTGSAPPGALGLQLSGICGVEFVLYSGVREEREEEEKEADTS